MDFSALLTGFPGDQIALGALVTIMVLSILRGWVVPRSVLVDRIGDKDAQIAALVKERDDWKTAYDGADKSRQELVKQNTDLIDAGQATTRLLETMRAKQEATP
jgi:cysteinyl-tRNA synthetase